jgi:hypothetical protein
MRLPQNSHREVPGDPPKYRWPHLTHASFFMEAIQLLEPERSVMST